MAIWSHRVASLLQPLAAAATALALVVVLVVPVPAAAATDTDRDGLTNSFETTKSHTDPLKADSDRNGVLDPAEDPDGDGLSNLGEQRFRTHPLKPDTDADGISDGREDANGNGISNAKEQDRRPVPRGLKPSLAGAFDDQPPSYADGCHNTGRDAHIHACVYGDRHGSVTVVLFGDSHAAQWLPGLISPAKAKGWRIVSLTKSACPSAGVRFKLGTSREKAACKKWRTRAVAWIGSHRPDVVLLSNFRGYVLTDAGGHRLRGAKSAAAWRKGLESTIRSLPAASRAVVLTDAPGLQKDPPTCLSAHRTRISACETPRSKAIDAAHVATEKAAAADTGASFENLNAVVCPYDPCPLIVGPFLLWREATHLTATYARQLAPSVGAMISRALSAAPPVAGAAPALAATDTDRDDLTNGFERTRSHTNPLKSDTDRDGLLDPAEDPDGDGLSNLGEQRFGTNPLKPDTDGDGIRDGREDSNGNGISNAGEQDRRPVPRNLRPSLPAAPDDTPVSYADGCHSGPLDPHIHPCVYGDPKGRLTVVLFGDSHAAQWLPGLIPPAKARGWRIVIITKSACPSVRVSFEEPLYKGAATSCNQWRRRAIAWTRSHLPDVILVASSRGYHLTDANGRRLPRARSVARWKKGFEDTLGSLPGASRAVVMADTPSFRAVVPTCLSAHPHRISACVTPRANAIDTALLAAEKTAAAAMGAAFENLDGVVCPYDPCPVIVGHFLMWRNASHLTATYARQLAPSVAAMMARVLARASP